QSKAELGENWKHNINLGLDLKGGSHLVYQVQLQDAFMAAADTVIEGLKDDLAKAGVSYSSMTRNDRTSIDQSDNIQISITGIPADKTTAFRSVVADRFPDWTLTP